MPHKLALLAASLLCSPAHAATLTLLESDPNLTRLYRTGPETDTIINITFEAYNVQFSPNSYALSSSVANGWFFIFPQPRSSLFIYSSYAVNRDGSPAPAYKPYPLNIPGAVNYFDIFNQQIYDYTGDILHGWTYSLTLQYEDGMFALAPAQVPLPPALLLFAGALALLVRRPRHAS